MIHSLREAFDESVLVTVARRYFFYRHCRYCCLGNPRQYNPCASLPSLCLFLNSSFPDLHSSQALAAQCQQQFLEVQVFSLQAGPLTCVACRNKHFMTTVNHAGEEVPVQNLSEICLFGKMRIRGQAAKMSIHIADS